MPAIKFDFSNNGIVVTGGASGIGLHTATAFLESGASVSIWDTNQSALNLIKSELARFGDRLHLSHTDVSSANAVREAAGKVPFNINILVNNAGITRDSSMKKLTEDDFDAVIKVDLNSAFYVTKAFFEQLTSTAGKNGRIINISSIVALYGNFGQANYAAAKAGLIGLTKTWAREFGPKHCTVNAVCPGFTATTMVKTIPADTVKEICEKTPVRRLGETRDIANAVLFLASQDSGFINGAILSVDGGITI